MNIIVSHNPTHHGLRVGGPQVVSGGNARSRHEERIVLVRVVQPGVDVLGDPDRHEVVLVLQLPQLFVREPGFALEELLEGQHGLSRGTGLHFLKQSVCEPEDQSDVCQKGHFSHDQNWIKESGFGEADLHHAGRSLRGLERCRRRCGVELLAIDYV